jgi:hypothetical protein
LPRRRGQSRRIALATAGSGSRIRLATTSPRDVEVCRTYTSSVSAEGITDDLVRKVADDLRARYDLDDEDMRALGARLAESGGPHSAENLEFAKRFTDKHRETFDRLAE